MSEKHWWEGKSLAQYMAGLGLTSVSDLYRAYGKPEIEAGIDLAIMPYYGLVTDPDKQRLGCEVVALSHDPDPDSEGSLHGAKVFRGVGRDYMVEVFQWIHDTYGYNAGDFHPSPFNYKSYVLKDILSRAMADWSLGYDKACAA